MGECPTCGHPTPEGVYCVRCGAPLAAGLDRARRRAQFAAAPRQSRWAPWLVSTLFPQLPRHSEPHVRVALGLGALVVAALAVERLFGVALITAALLMPLITLMYFYDVDVYRDSPGWAIAWTVVWGALAGAGIGLITHALAPTGAALIDKSSTAQVLIGGLLIPAIGVLAALAGPLVLLPHRRYNDTLDGASFGSAAAATFAAAEVIVVGSGVLTGGLRPPGAGLPWLTRLLALAVATPVLSMSAAGFAAAALWLRYRAPAADRHALGMLGRPVAAVGLALLLVIGGAVAETMLPVGLWLAWLALLDAAALMLLRAAVHVGLLEEAAEGELGPEIRCANCGALTVSHTFCGRCGIALRALPNARAGGEAPAGAFTGRLPGRWRGAAHAAVAASLVLGSAAVALGVVVLVTPASRRPPCRPGAVCAGPPLAHALAGLFGGYTGWRSSALGYSLRYRSAQWKVASEDASDLVLQASDGVSQIAVHAVPAGSATPAGLIADRRSALAARLLGLSHDPTPADRVLGPNVGLVPGPGAVYRATTNLPQAPDTPVSIAVMAASAGAVGIVATVITPANNPGEQATIFGEADDVLNSITYEAP